MAVSESNALRISPGTASPGTPARERVGRTRIRAATAITALVVLLALAVVVAISLGPVQIPFLDTCQILLARIGIHVGSTSQRFSLVVDDIRLPRVLLAVLAGAGLAVVGAVMQALFRNPLADPGVTGVSSGAAAGAVLVLVTGVDVFGPWTLQIAAFGGALLALVTVQIIALVRKDRSPTTLLLAGIALNALLGATVGAIISNAPDSQTVRSAVFWLQGDLSAASWSVVQLIALPVLGGIVLVIVFSRELNIMLLGDEQARSAGLDVVRTRRLLLVITAILTGVIVSATGVIGFVGLVVPHIVRLVLTSDHRLLLPATALLGATFLVVADLIARLLFSPVSLQTGVVTALLGAPVFLLLVLRPQQRALGRR